MLKEVQLTIGHVIGIIFSVALLTILIGSVATSLEMEPASGVSLLFGDAGILPFIASVITVALVALGAWHGLQTLSHSQKSEAANRFQRGAEMLGSESSITRIAALYVLRDTARDWPDLYASTAVNTIVASISEADRQYKDTLVFNGGVGNVAMPKRSDLVTPRALTVLSEINRTYNGQWPKGAHQMQGQLLVQSLFVNYVLRHDEYFADINFRHTFIGRWHLFNASLKNVNMSATLSERFVLKNCDLSGANLNFYEADMETYRRPGRDELIIRGGNIVNATVNGGSVTPWYRQ